MGVFLAVSADNIALLWLVAAVALFVIEALTVNLVCIWFACGALLAMTAAFLGASFMVQMTVFLITSVAVLFFARPLLKKKLIPNNTPTNADMVVGQIGLVIETIDNLAQTGRVLANGLDWMARTQDDCVIPAQERVLVKSIHGVKLIVEPIDQNEEEGA